MESEPDKVITAIDYVEALEQEELDAHEILPFDPSHCFYEKGKIRQLVYSCKTCKKETGEYCGVCYSCFVSCHTDHEMVELDYRRDFTCDCGTSRSTIKCSILKTPREENSNVYNANFDGIFCYCKREFVDTEETTMYQCYFCEDWFHLQCIGEEAKDDYDEYICKDCIKSQDWILSYCHDGVFDRVEAISSDCFLKSADGTESGLSPRHFGVFLKEGWKGAICKCQTCLSMFEDKGISFIAIVNENCAPELDQAGSTLEEGLDALNRMDRVKALDGIRHYGKLKEGLLKYLKTFAETGKVVTEEDISSYFNSLKRKRED